MRGRPLWAEGGKGWYKYEADARASIPELDVERLIDETLTLGRKRRAIDDDEILERMMFDRQ